MRVPELCVCVWHVMSDLALPVHFLLVFYWLLLAISPGSIEAHLHGVLNVCVVN